MPIHFEDLWEQCEEFHKKFSDTDSSHSILDELIMKINLYKAMDQKIEILNEEKKKIKSRLLGEILLTLTNLSLKDDINVFESLFTAHNFRKIN